MSVVNSTPLLLGDDGYQISRSVRLRSSASAYFNRTPASTGNRTTWTWSGWVKRGAIGASGDLFGYLAVGSQNNQHYLGFSTDSLYFVYYPNGANSLLTTTQVFRDPSAWYHIVAVWDTTNATATNRMRLYVNGVQVTVFASANYPALNQAGLVNVSGNGVGLGAAYPTVASGHYFDGYLTEVNFIDGQALTPSSFGETNAVTGVWQPKKYTGTYGTNGFYLNFADNSAATAAAIGADKSGNGNNWTPNNISVTAGATYDSMIDVPTMWADGGNGRGNYAVLNPVDTSGATLSNANLQVVTSATAGNATRGTMAVSSGKWYWEVTPTAGTNSAVMIGVADAGFSIASANYQTANFWGYYGFNGNKYNANTATAYGASYAANDVIGVALDMDAGTVSFYKNNVSQGPAYSTLSGKTISPSVDNGGAAQTAIFNFGQRPFAYTPPTGFKALNTQNLPDATIVKGSTAFNIALDTGANIKTSTEALFGTNYLEWIKDRANANNHQLLDTVRGTTAVLQSNTTAAETTYLAPAGSSVGWAWKKGVTQGFDIVTYTGTGANRTVAHSLGVAPKMVIVKSRSQGGTTTYSWAVWQTALAGAEYLLLNGTAAKATAASVWNSTVPTSSVFSLGTDSIGNGSTVTYVAYLFAEVAGFSKFGSYTGNGLADGPFVFCGFRPRFVMFKRTDAVEGWYMYDTARDTINAMRNELRAESSAAEAVFSSRDFLSNGFKVRTANGSVNASGGTYIFMAFAENPFKYSLAR